MADSIYDTNSITTIEELEKVSSDEYRHIVEVPSGANQEEWEKLLNDEGVQKVTDNDGNDYYIRIVNINDKPTGGAKYSNQAVKIHNSGGNLYEITSSGGLIGDVKAGFEIAGAMADSAWKIFSDDVAKGMGIIFNYDDPNFQAFFNDFSNSITDGLFDGNTLPIIFKLESDGIHGYVNSTTYNQVVQYMIDNHIATVVDYDDYNGYNSSERTLIVDNREANVSAMINQVIGTWYLKSNITSKEIAPEFKTVRDAFHDRLAGVRSTFHSITGHYPNVFNFTITHNGDYFTRLTVEGYYISKKFTLYNKDRPNVYSSDITSSYGSPISVMGGWQFDYDSGWEFGSAITFNGVEFPSSSFLVYPVKASTEYPSGISGFNESWSDGNGSANSSNWNSGFIVEELPPNIPVTRLPNAPVVIRTPNPPTPQDYIKVINPKEEPVTNDDPFKPSNTVIYYEVPFSNEDVQNIINNNSTTINNYYYYNTTPTQSDIGSIVAPPTSVVTGESNALYTIYNPTQSEIESFGGWLWSSNVIEILKTVFQNPLDAVLSLQIIYGIPSIGGRKEIKCGYLGSGVQSNYVNNQYITVDCGAVNLFEFYGDARDYAPYTEIQLFLPFIGFVALDVYEVMASVMNITYIIDILTGTCIASIKVSRDGTEKVLYSFNGNCAVQLPLSSADKSTLITGAVSGALSGAGMGMHFGGVGTAVGAVAGAVIGGATSGISINRSGNMSGNAGALGIKKPYLLVKRYKSYSAVGYGGLVGVADNYRCRIGDMTGFTQFTGIKLNVSATETELKEIETLLTDGVFV